MRPASWWGRCLAVFEPGGFAGGPCGPRRGAWAACGVRRAWLAAGPFRSACASGCAPSLRAPLVSDQW